MTVHDLKTWPAFFDEVRSGNKPFELRRNDRDYHVGDILLLREWNPDTEQYTGLTEVRYVTYVTHYPAALREGFVCMGLSERDRKGGQDK